eukprot:gene927-biopygen7350
MDRVTAQLTEWLRREDRRAASMPVRGSQYAADFLGKPPGPSPTVQHTSQLTPPAHCIAPATGMGGGAADDDGVSFEWGRLSSLAMTQSALWLRVGDGERGGDRADNSSPRAVYCGHRGSPVPPEVIQGAEGVQLMAAS